MKLNKLPTYRVLREFTDFPKEPTVGDLIVYHHFEQNAMTCHHMYAVATSNEAMEVIDHLAKTQVGDESVAYNAFGLVVFQTDNGETSPNIDPSKVDCEWEEWSSDIGMEIDEVMKERDENAE
jgi:hypothetical protein